MLQDRFVRSLLGGLIVVALVTWFGNRWLREHREEELEELLDGSADPSTFDVTLRQCRSEAGATEATVTLENRSDRTNAFGVEVVFTGPRGFVLDSVETWSRAISPGAGAEVHVQTTATGAGQEDTRCELSAVNDVRPSTDSSVGP